MASVTMSKRDVVRASLVFAATASFVANTARTRHVGAEMRVIITALLLLLAPLSGRAQDEPTCEPFALTLHIASADETGARAKVDAWLSLANQQFAAADVCFAVDAQHGLGTERRTIDDIRERRSLRKSLRPRTINVFVVEEILDPNPSEATRRAASWQGFSPSSGKLSGAHIEADGHTPGTYLLIALSSDKLTLAHELGHFMGVGHHRDPENIMSYGRARTRFADTQLDTFRRRARALRRTVRQKL